MVDSGGSDRSQPLRLRAHHICCTRFRKGTSKGRSLEFRQTKKKIKGVLLSQSESRVTAIEGVDELCQVCPLCVDGRCNSPRGDEDKVRKWDAILLKELGLPCESCLTPSEWQALIEQKTPFRICKKCQWAKVCSVGAKLL